MNVLTTSGYTEVGMELALKAVRRLSNFALALLMGASLHACAKGVDGSPPGVPGALRAEAHDGYNVLTWEPSSGATSYNFYWSISPGVTRETGFRVATPGTPANHGGIVNGTKIYYVIEAVNAAGASELSSETSATPQSLSASLDPYYTLQWNLKNTGQSGANGSTATLGEDINVEPAWSDCSNTQNTCRGEGVRVAVVDGDLEIGHEDLLANVASGASYDYGTGSNDPSGKEASDFHGTAVGGIIAARDLNGLGLRGIAPRANLVGYNFVSYPTFSNQADAMVRGASGVSVSNNSWGPADGQGLLWSTPFTWRNAIEQGLTEGRGGKGIVYVWSAGNGALGSDCATSKFRHYCADNSNYDGYANYRGVMAVGAVGADGVASSYSEPGANLWISAPGGEFCDYNFGILSTDAPGSLRGLNSTIGYNYGSYELSNRDYTQCMNGTSAAAPHISGAAALVVQANPNLNWRAIRWVMAASARKNDPTHPDWATNGAGFHFNPFYGFGVVDINAAVHMAKTFADFGTQKTFATSKSLVSRTIPQSATGTGVSDVINVASGSGGISSIEWVEVTFQSSHSYSGDLEVALTHSTSGMKVLLAEKHFCAPLDGSQTSAQAGDCEPYDNWVFGDAAHLGESPAGNWTLSVVDRRNDSISGTFDSWSMKFYGR